jgi:site-specific DNA-methyltransferase (adenine-specific)
MRTPPRPYFRARGVTLHRGDCLQVLRRMRACSVDAVVTDPPYHLRFMGLRWDCSGVAFKTDTWREVLRVMKPGAHLLAFGGTRTWHRLACALEDAGFEVRDTLCWLNGQGWPKSRHALKPAWEPVLMCRRPGRSVLNVDACRIAAAGGDYSGHGNTTPRLASAFVYNAAAQGRMKPTRTSPHPAGRWPPNVTLDAHAAALLDAQSGERRTSKPGRVVRRARARAHVFDDHAADIGRVQTAYGDTGGASRFYYCAKASRRERGAGNTHPTTKPLNLCRWLVRLVTPPGGLVLDAFAGSGTTLLAARAEGRRAVGVELSARYCAIARKRLESAP